MAGPVTRIIRFLAEDGKTYYGEEPEMGCPSVVVLSGDVLGGEAKRTQQRAMLKKLLAPVLPTEIFCIGLNYMKHFEELSKKIGVPLPTRPVLFMKPVSTLAHPGDNIWLPSLPNATVDYEVELVLVISKDCRNVSRADWKSVVCGYTVANDVSSRHWQREAGAGQWIKGKSFDTFCPLGPVLVTKGAIPDPTKLRVLTRVNGEVRQDESVTDLIFDCGQIIEWLSNNMTLRKGTVILTGTPAGVGGGKEPAQYLQAGDVVECEVPGIGVLSNKVVPAPAHALPSAL